MFGDERASPKEISLFLVWLQCQGWAVSEIAKLETHVRMYRVGPGRAGPGRAAQYEKFPLVDDELAQPSASLVIIRNLFKYYL